MVHGYASHYIDSIYKWITRFLETARTAADLLGAHGWLLPKELKSFIGSPEDHLRKKLFQYTLDLGRGRLGVGEYLSKARSAITTSIRTNMRSIYQYWAFSAILVNLARLGARIIYPEHGYILIERTGRQRSGGIPPNLILRLPGGEVSFFLEAPRPVGWGDGRDLRRTWRLYTSLRPDMLVYGGRVMDIVDMDGEGPPIKRPDIVVEFKELEDWFNRVRYLKGPITRPLTAEEWFNRWLDGLWEGLSEVLGVSRGQVQGSIRRAGLRVREYKLVQLYKETFKPDLMILVSRTRLPGEVREDLEGRGITVVDGVEIGEVGKLSWVSEEIARRARPSSVGDLVEDLLTILRSRGVDASPEEVADAARRVLIDRIDEIISLLRDNK